MPSSKRYRTGRPDLDAAILELIAAAEITEDADLLFEMLVTAVRLGREDVTRGDRKLVNAALKEIRYALGVFAPYREVRKCSVFGSARTPAEHPAYTAAHEFANALTAPVLRPPKLSTSPTAYRKRPLGCSARKDGFRVSPASTGSLAAPVAGSSVKR